MLTPEKFGVPASAVAAFLDRLSEKRVNMHGFILMRGENTLAEGYWKPFSAERPHRMFSVSKTMTALAIGILTGRGRLSVDDRIADYFPDMLPERPDERLMRLTIRDMLRMATCRTGTVYKQTDADWTKSFFTAPVTHEAGTVFNYDTSAAQTLAALAERLSGKPLLDFLQSELFDKIGARGEKRWLTDGVGTAQGGTGLVMTLRDMALTARLIMRGGDGIVPRGFIESMTKKQSETPFAGSSEERHGYGWQMWMSRDGYMMYGMGGQLALCVPKKDLLLCTTADTRFDSSGVQNIEDAFFESICPNVKDEPLPESSDGALAEKINALHVPVPEFGARALTPLPLEFEMQPNSMGIKRLSLTVEALKWSGDSGEYVFPYLAGKLCECIFPHSSEPCHVTAYWLSQSVFRLTALAVGDILCGVDIQLAISGDYASLQIKRTNELLTEGLEGVAGGGCSLK
ncbi:MAG: serine hydrolase [Eubacteriales bacterium]|nr:serine hydrolase [Eubacteriales bacterium]MDD3882829.1 serine hydrolase [Eubacteriales bacterium]MDD4513273.1 serine hydrolase [Eubacteriales bacterium]